MPVIVSDGRLVQFVYWPRYLQAKKYKDITTPPTCYSGLDFSSKVLESVIILDGGNIQICRKTAIVTERIFDDNYWYERDDLIEKIKNTLSIDKMIVIPVEPGDETGHSDGVVRFIDETSVLLNDYTSLPYLKAYDNKIKTILKQSKMDIIPFPYTPTQNKTNQGMPSAEGVYINFLRVKKLILVPVFQNNFDDHAVKTLSEVFDGYHIHPIDCHELASQGGGIINCVSWELPES